MRQNLKVSEILGLLMLPLLCIFSESAKNGMISGMDICYRHLIPALFPFLIVSDLIFSITAKLCFRTPLCRLLGLSACEYACFWLSQFGGYPMGSKLLAFAGENGMIDGVRAKKLAPVFLGCGPSFAIGCVGSILQNKKLGIVVFVCCVLTNLILLTLTAKTLPAFAKLKITKQPVSHTLCESIQSGSIAMVTICGSVLFYSTLSAIVRSLLPALSLLLPAAEVCSGVFLLGKFYAGAPVYAALLSFGGLAVQSQVMLIAPKLHQFWYLFGVRCEAACIGFAICKIALTVLPDGITASAVTHISLTSPGSDIWCFAALILFILSAGQSLSLQLRPDLVQYKKR